MKLTQAQIEAEEDALFYGTGFIRTHADGSMERIDPREIVVTKPTQAQITQAQIEAAMAAYDRVFESGSPVGRSERAMSAALTAAAEVGEPLGKLVMTRETFAEQIKRNEAATIERCAQICDALAHVELCADDTIRGAVNARPYQVSAAAIRALKDEP